MDWLRRNWPDLAIGLALVAVIAGIVATLITGGSFFPSASPQAPTTPIVVPPATPSMPVLPPVADPPTATAPTTAGSPPAAAQPPASDAPAPSPGAVSVLTPEGAEVPTTPAAPAPAPTPAPTTAPSGPTVQPVDPPVAAAPAPTSTPAPAATPTPTPAPATPPAAAATPAPTPAPGPASADVEAPYRVSVGAFGNPDNAARQAETFRTAGYPVFTGTQGALTIVLVGPYDSEAEAQVVAARIAAGGFGIEPVVYRYRPDAATPGASTPVPAAAPAATPTPAPATSPTPAAAASPAPAPAASPAPAPVATAPSGRSLQVGAFADASSAAPLRERLAALGLVAFEIREDGLVKLLVGPFEQERLASVRQQLAAQGIESFPR